MHQPIMLNTDRLYSWYNLYQGSPNVGLQAKSGPRSHFIWPAKPYCQYKIKK